MADAFIHTAATSNRMADSFNRMADSFTGLADVVSRTVGSASHTADGFIHTAGSSSLMAGQLIRLAGVSSRTAGRSNHASKSFIGAGKSSSRTVFSKKHAKTGKNRLFSPSSHVNCSKSDSCGWGYRQSRQRLGLRQPSAALDATPRSKAAEGCRSPKPHGLTRPHSPQSTIN
jgi:hypothetical protein